MIHSLTIARNNFTIAIRTHTYTYGTFPSFNKEWDPVFRYQAVDYSHNTHTHTHTHKHLAPPGHANALHASTHLHHCGALLHFLHQLRRLRGLLLLVQAWMERGVIAVAATDD